MSCRFYETNVARFDEVEYREDGEKGRANPDALCLVCRHTSSGAFAIRERVPVAKHSRTHQMQRITVNIILLDEFPFVASSPVIRFGERDPYLICNRAYDFQFTLLNRANGSSDSAHALRVSGSETSMCARARSSCM